MKKTVTVSLGGMVFCLEDDAYYTLDSYLRRLENSFAGESDRREIMNDIETRMAEHFKEKAPTTDEVINLAEVVRVIGIMGEPSDFADSSKNFNTSGRAYYVGGKRLYRDPETKVFGGVCSGLGHYWNIDPVVLRILFFIVALWGGGGVVVYIILWIAIPEARTVAERLEMTGEPVTAENIGKSFQNDSSYRK
jgi:phage shock protein PspC (stress-responsive transcriptional regulator)